MEYRFDLGGRFVIMSLVLFYTSLSLFGITWTFFFIDENPIFLKKIFDTAGWTILTYEGTTWTCRVFHTAKN